VVFASELRPGPTMYLDEPSQGYEPGYRSVGHGHWTRLGLLHIKSKHVVFLRVWGVLFQ